MTQSPCVCRVLQIPKGVIVKAQSSRLPGLAYELASRNTRVELPSYESLKRRAPSYLSYLRLLCAPRDGFHPACGDPHECTMPVCTMVQKRSGHKDVGTQN